MKQALVAATVIGLLGSVATAQSTSLGAYEYATSCAQCHGADAKGEGPLTQYLVNVPPDLTVLQKNNGGVLPVERLYGIIEGSVDVGAHGRDMPLWGDRFAAEAPEREFAGAPHWSARARILSVIEHLSTLQVE